ncbi:MAG: cytochrome C oxidase subunit I [Casimicrobiaceae bacterium]
MPLVLIALVCIAPMIVSWLVYHFIPRDSRTNYGSLLVTAPAPPLVGTAADGGAFTLAGLSGRWVMLTAAGGACDATCEGALYAMRQARTIQGRERDRVVRVWLVTDGATVPPALLAAHPDLMIVRAPAAALADWPQGAGAIYLVDPFGNEVLAWPRAPDIKKLANDLSRLLRASQIG